MLKEVRAVDGNEAVAYIAHRVTEASAIYPITPSTPMGEWADAWSAEGIKNIWGHVPTVIEMQSEGGASGTLHGLTQAGILATSFTASQGLLLMIPNLYKIAGELSPAVLHIASRSLAAQALSIFGDHTDVMAARHVGWAMLCSGSVQEAHDLALISHAATLESRIPFMHFFEGFRTSHEINLINMLSDDDLRSMIDDKRVFEHRARALNPEHPFIRGTSQNPDVYFQARETVNPFYRKTPDVVQSTMNKFKKLTGREYRLMTYRGHPEAEYIVILMGSGAKTVDQTVEFLQKQKEKVGCLQIYLYRPFSVETLAKALPKTVKAIAVLDRTKEIGAVGEPLYQDVVTALNEARAQNLVDAQFQPTIIGGRYGLSSKEFTPAMVKGVFEELKKDKPKNHFTIGIEDDVSKTSLFYNKQFRLDKKTKFRGIFYGLGSDGTVGANKNSIKIIGEDTPYYAQAYFVYDSKKAGTQTVSHLRFDKEPILAPYLIESASFIGIHQFQLIYRIEVLAKAEEGATVLLNSPYSPDDVLDHLPLEMQEILIRKKLSLYVVDAYKVAHETGMGGYINTIMQTCFFALSKVLPQKEAIDRIKAFIRKSYTRKGVTIVEKNFKAVDQALSHLFEVKLPTQVIKGAQKRPPIVSEKAPKFVQQVTAKMIAGKGDELPTSVLPADGTYPSATACWEKRNISMSVACWDPETCVQCGMCHFVCPHGVIRVKPFDEKNLEKAPEGFKSAPLKGKREQGNHFGLQVYIEDCTGCGLCHEACPVRNKTQPKDKAINMRQKAADLTNDRKSIEFFESLPESEAVWWAETITVKDAQYLRPLFEFSGACAGCGETPYLRLISQLFGDRMVVANATGCSSIYGGNLPTTPWAVNAEGRGPAWSNSLFEDNAEFGLGFQLAEEQHREQAKNLLSDLSERLGKKLSQEIIEGMKRTDRIGLQIQREQLLRLKNKLLELGENPKAKHLLSLIDHLVKRSIWIVGGDGWAYDIGYGGLDHVLASHHDVNILVLDTEVYSNTGGQSSKATPMGAIAKFSAGGKRLPRKDLGLMAMSYGYVYVAQIAMGANPQQSLKALLEAEAYPGPSLIIAYSQCIAHGINMRLGMHQQKLAVQSGFWPLYRYNPLRKQAGENPFVLDSEAPKVPLEEYLYNENRFKALKVSNPTVAASLLQQAKEEVKHRFCLYEKMAKGSILCDPEEP
jgi:pyruvate-ferredoxin/flavodoxin oxidoreductase